MRSRVFTSAVEQRAATAALTVLPVSWAAWRGKARQADRQRNVVSRSDAGKQLHNDTSNFSKMDILSKKTIIVFVALIHNCVNDDVWEKDMSEEIYIEASHDGFRHVKLQ